MFDVFKQAWIAWMVLVAFAVTSLTPVGGLVVCIGDDGHLAIELASPDADCADCESTASTTSCCTETGAARAACECYDIPLLSGTQPTSKPAPSQARVIVPHPTLLATLDFGFSPPLSNHFGIGRGALPPPCPRIPTLLTLRI